MAHIFISYSSNDRTRAAALAQQLCDAGYTCWMDISGIDAATSWSKEIANALEESAVVCVLLSVSSLASPNVAKELGVAAELGKRFLPIKLEPVRLHGEFLYHLANLQRVAADNFEAIASALTNLGILPTTLSTAVGTTPKLRTSKPDDRKSLMILPFEDLSPSGDNQWFADGLASELITALSNVNALKLIDWNTSRGFKNKQIPTTTIAAEFNVRYFIEGQVRKFGDQIKISMTLLDVVTGDHLWQDSLRGELNDIFDLQETAARKVTDGLHIRLGQAERQRLSLHGTTVPEAYEAWMKGVAYFQRVTKADFEHALHLYERAAELDPTYGKAHAAIANTLCTIWQQYDRNPSYLERAEAVIETLRQLEGESLDYLWVASTIALRRGQTQRALTLAQRAVDADPGFAPAHNSLATVLEAIGDLEGMVRERREDARLRENHLTSQWNLLTALDSLRQHSDASEHDRLQREHELNDAASDAIPLFERHARLTPDDLNARTNLAAIYTLAGRTNDALREAQTLASIDTLDGQACYNLACVFIRAHDLTTGLELIRRAIRNGLQDFEGLALDHDLDPLRGMPEFEELMKESAPNPDSTAATPTRPA